MNVLTPTQAEVLDDVMTMAATLCASAYKCGAERVDFKVNEDNLTLIVFAPPKFQLGEYLDIHPSFPLSLDQTGQQRALSNGSGSHVYFSTLAYDVTYCVEDDGSTDDGPDGDTIADEAEAEADEDDPTTTDTEL